MLDSLSPTGDEWLAAAPFIFAAGVIIVTSIVEPVVRIFVQHDVLRDVASPDALPAEVSPVGVADRATWAADLLSLLTLPFVVVGSFVLSLPAEVSSWIGFLYLVVVLVSLATVVWAVRLGAVRYLARRRWLTPGAWLALLLDVLSIVGIAIIG